MEVVSYDISEMKTRNGYIRIGELWFREVSWKDKIKLAMPIEKEIKLTGVYEKDMINLYKIHEKDKKISDKVIRHMLNNIHTHNKFLPFGCCKHPAFFMVKKAILNFIEFKKIPQEVRLKDSMNFTINMLGNDYGAFSINPTKPFLYMEGKDYLLLILTYFTDRKRWRTELI